MVDDMRSRGVKSAVTVAHAMSGIPYKLIYNWIGNKENITEATCKASRDRLSSSNVRKRKNEELDDKLLE